MKQVRKKVAFFLMILFFGFSPVFVSAINTNTNKQIYEGVIEPLVLEDGIYEITLKDVTIDASSSNVPAISIEEGTQVTLKLEGDNFLTGASGYAGIAVIPAYDDNGNYNADNSGKLTITGSGNLTVVGGNGDQSKGTYGGGAGIGGNGEEQNGAPSVDFGTIIIDELFTGKLVATGGNNSIYEDGSNAFGGGAGIGSGGMNMGYLPNYTDVSPYYWGEVFGNIIIKNGTIEATSNGNGSGIGAGGTQGEDTVESSITIMINNGQIFATGGLCAAGIGGGENSDGGIITITDGIINAKSGPSDGASGGAGIGGGVNASVKEINITGGTITAESTGGAGIGGGANTTYSSIHYGDTNGERNEEKVAKITISGKGTVVNAYGSTSEGYSGLFGGAGIGSGYPVANNARSVAFDIILKDHATINAYGGYHAQAIGYGYRPGSGDSYYTGYGIRLTMDDTIQLWASNYDNYLPALVVETDYDHNPIQYESTDIYLAWYQNNNKLSTDYVVSDTEGTFVTLNKAGDFYQANWNFIDSTSTLKITIGSETKELTIPASNISGSFATLIPNSQLKLQFQLVGNYKPDGVEENIVMYLSQGISDLSYIQSKLSVSGYKLDGFYIDEDCTIEYEEGMDLTSINSLYYMLYPSSQLKLQFQLVGNYKPNDVNEKIVMYLSQENSDFSEIQSKLSVDGYELDGFYIDEDCTIKYEEGMDLTSIDSLYYMLYPISNPSTLDSIQTNIVMLLSATTLLLVIVIYFRKKNFSNCNRG